MSAVLGTSPTGRKRYRPTLEEFEIVQHERDMARAAIDIEKLRTSDQVHRVAELRERLARHPKWCAFCAFVGFLLGGVLGRAL